MPELFNAIEFWTLGRQGIALQPFLSFVMFFCESSSSGCHGDFFADRNILFSFIDGAVEYEHRNRHY